MRKNSYRSGKRGYGTKTYAELKSYAPTYGNVNWGPDKVCMVREPGSSGSGQLSLPTRFFSITPESVNAGEQSDESIFLKAVHVDFPVLPIIGMARVNGTLQQYSSTVRDDIPFQTGITEDTGYTGYLLGGGIENSPGEGSMSHAEGMPLNWCLTWDTYAEWSELELGGAEPFDSAFYKRGKRVFDQGVTVPTIYRPGRIKFDKRFPGKGTKLESVGQRGLYAMSLWIWLPQGTLGTTVTDGLSVVTSNGRFDYFDND